MFMPTGGGGKGNRPQSTHQQQNNHQTQHQHSHPPHHHHQQQQQQNPQQQQQSQVQSPQQQQQSRISLLQQQQDQQQQPQAVIVPQPSSVSALNTLAGIHHHHHSTQQQQAQQQQQQQQQLQQQHHLQQQPIIFYATQPPPQLPAAYASHAQQQQQHSSSSSSNGSNGGAALQLSGAASNATLGHAGPHGHAHAHHHLAAPPPHGPHGPHAHAHANGVLTPATSNTNLVRALSNSTLPPHFTPSAGLIAPGAGANGSQGSTTFMTAAFLPFNHPGQLIGAPSMGFPANGAAAAPAAGFYTAAPPPQKQQLAAGQQPGGGAQPTITYYHGTLPPTAAQLSANNGNANVSGSNPNSSSQRGSMRGGQRSTPPQQPSYFAPYGAAAPPPRPQLVNNAAAAAVTPILNTRNNAINGGAAFHLPPAYCPLGPPPNLTAAPQLMAAPTGGGPTGLHTYAPHLQSSSATAVGVGVGVGAVPGVTSSFSSTSLNTGQQLLSGGGAGVAEKVKERRHAIPIIHPVTQEDVMDPKSSVFNKKDSNCTLTSSSTGSDASIGHKTSQEVAIKVDHQMQTEVASKSAIVFSGQAAAAATLPLTDEDKVSVIVKDILANSGNPEEHLSFLQFNDVDNTSEHTPESSGGGSMDNYYNENAAGNSMKPAAHFQESQKSKMQQRPKSANKQSTATPTSIATAVAEAVAGVGILGDIQRATMHHQQQQQSAKSSTAELCPVSPSKGQKQQQQQKPIVQKQTWQQQQQQQQHQLQSHSQQPSTSSSSAASTPTHQPRLQPQMRATIGGIKAGAAATPTVAATDMAAGATNTLSKKNQRKAQKRKELEKKKQKTTGPPTTTASSMSTASGSSSSTLTASSSSNTNAKTNAKGSSSSNTVTTGAAAAAAATSGAETSLIFVTTTKTTSGVAIAMPTTTDKLSATSNNSSLSFSLRDKQQPKEQQQPHDTELNFDSKEEKKHLANEEIVAKFLLKSCDDEQPSLVEPQLQFLNSSSSVCEEDSSNTSEKCTEKESSQTEEHNVDELKFGDFSEEVPTHHSSFICSSTWSSSQPPVEAPKSVDNVDCAAQRHSVTELPNSNISSKKSSPVHQPEKQEKVTQPKVSKVAAKSTTAATPKFIRYNIEQLRELSKLSESRKPPLVPCQKGDCIAQLFVSRQSQQQQQHHHGHNQHGQQYQQHAHDAMDYMSGKRGRGHGGHGLNKKHHDNYQSMGGGNASGNSSSGGGGMGGQSNQRYMDIIRVQLSLKEEIKLSECENAWQPETLRRMSMFSAPTAAAATEADKENELEAVLKKVRGILNKLTPDNFEVLLKEMSSIKMDTQSKMTNVMLLIFEKTISEPNFAPTYARFCKVLFHEIKAENKSLFTSSLITRIQHEFESNVNDANAKAKKLQPTQDRINACSDATKKAELRAEMEDLEYQFRRRAWGTVRFIGELFKLQSLTSDRVLHCVESLLEHGCEEKLEYMCKLLTTVGHLLEAGSSEQYQSGGRIEKIFRRIQDIVQRSRGNNSSYRQHQQNIKISSRVRFMMQDVLDLRARNWDQPAGATHTTGGIRQQQQQRHKQLDEPKAQQQQQQRGGHQQQQGGYQYQQQQQKQQHHHHGHDGGGNYFLQKLNKSHQQENQSLSIDPTKLRFSSSNNDDVTAKLGNSSHYQWRNVGNRPVSAAAATTQPTLLKRMPSSASSTNPFSYPPYQQQSQTPPAVATPILSRSNSSTNNNNADNSPSEVSFNDKQCQEVITKLVEEVVSTRGWQNEVLSIWRSLVAKQPEAEAVILYVLMDYVHRGTVKRQQRLACANAFGYLMDQQALDMATFNQAYTRFGEGFPDLLVDVPNGWTYVFEFLGPIMHDGHLELKDVWQRRWLDDSKCTLFFVRSFVSYFVQEFGAGYAHKLWHVDNQLDRGQMFWSDARKFRDFLQANSFQFLEPNGTGTAAGLQQRSKVTRTPGEHVERISYLLSLSSDTAIDYINTNVHINANFVRQLTKFLCCDFALTNNNTNNNNKGGVTPQLQLNVETFRMQCTPLLRLCIDAQEAHEVACIDETVESLREHHLVEIEDELAAGEAICSALGVLYDCEVISRDSFDKWIKRQIEKPANWSRPLMTKLRALIEEM